MLAALDNVSAGWANVCTFTAIYALMLIIGYFRPYRDAFGVVAPQALKWTAFEKYSSSDSVSVVNGEALYIVYYSFFHSIIFSALSI